MEVVVGAPSTARALRGAQRAAGFILQFWRTARQVLCIVVLCVGVLASVATLVWVGVELVSWWVEFSFQPSPAAWPPLQAFR